ncbi:MAG: cation diffusion facilitator family transporter [Pseudobdellovibrionaceae bacterium]
MKGHDHSSHDHGHSHHHLISDGNPDTIRRIGFAFVLNAGFAIAELIGGLYLGSTAIIADAIHDFGDSLTLGIALLLQKMSERGRSASFSYGYGRVSLLASLLSGIVLVIGSILVLVKAAPEIFNPTRVPHGFGMMIFAIVGICVNGFAAYFLKKGSTQNERVLSWHLLEDLLGWATVLVGSIVIMNTGWGWVDPLLAVLIASFILFNVCKNLWKTIYFFLQGAPDGFNEDSIRKSLRDVNNIVEIHDIHAWTLDGDRHIISLHIVIRDILIAASTKNQVREVMAKLGKFHTTIEVELEGESHGAYGSDHNH